MCYNFFAKRLQKYVKEKFILKKAVSIVLCLILVICCFAGCGGEKAEWEIFLDEYESVVDDYVKISKKYMENPTDTSILSEYTKLSNKIAGLSERAKKVQAELTDDSKALSEYTKRLSKILAKISDIN